MKLFYLILVIILTLSVVKTQNWVYTPSGPSIIFTTNMGAGTYSINYTTLLPTTTNYQQVQYLAFYKMGTTTSTGLFNVKFQNSDGAPFIHYYKGSATSNDFHS